MLFIAIMSFICGAGFSLLGIMLFGLSRLKKLDAKRKEFAQQIANKDKITSSVSDRINQALDICERQFDIMSGLEGPQNGPMHGKHKQVMGAELKRLEEEKMTIFRSILADGFDPSLGVINEMGEKESIKLSEFVNRMELLDQKKNPKARYTKPQEPVRPKLSLVKKTDEEAK